MISAVNLWEIAMDKFRGWNTKICYALALTLDEDAEKAYKEHPFAWLWLLIPIAGISFFHHYAWAENINRRYRELNTRCPQGLGR